MNPEKPQAAWIAQPVHSSPHAEKWCVLKGPSIQSCSVGPKQRYPHAAWQCSDNGPLTLPSATGSNMLCSLQTPRTPLQALPKPAACHCCGCGPFQICYKAGSSCSLQPLQTSQALLQACDRRGILRSLRPISAAGWAPGQRWWACTGVPAVHLCQQTYCHDAILT